MEENKMAKEAFLHLQSSEAMVAQMAATIFGALLANKAMAAGDLEAMVEQSVALAVKIAARTEQAIKSDEEWVRKDAGSSFLAG